MTRMATTLRIQREDPWCHDARILLDELGAALALSTGSSGQTRFYMEEVCSARGAFLIARTTEGEAVGCGGFRRFDYGVAEVQRMFSRTEHSNVGKALLSHLEELAAVAGYHTLVANTHNATRHAKNFFWRNGFTPTMTYGPYYTSQREFFMEKALATGACRHA
jgi:GNAT superfamily N-acetyltransferase